MNNLDIEKQLKQLFAEEEKQFSLPETNKIVSSTEKLVEYQKRERKRYQKHFTILATASVCFLLVFSFMIYNHFLPDTSDTPPASTLSEFWVDPAWMSISTNYALVSPISATNEKETYYLKECTAIECEIIFQWHCLSQENITSFKKLSSKEKIYVPSEYVEDFMKHETILIPVQYSCEQFMIVDQSSSAKYIPYTDGQAQFRFDLYYTKQFKDISLLNSMIDQMQNRLTSSADPNPPAYVKAYPTKPFSNGISIVETIEFFSDITVAQNLYQEFLSEITKNK